MAKRESAKEKYEHEARAGRKEDRSRKHREAESRGMKKAMDKGHAHHHKKAAHHLEKAHDHISRMHESAKEKHDHEAAAGRKYNRSEKHRERESEGMRRAMRARHAK